MAGTFETKLKGSAMKAELLVLLATELIKVLKSDQLKKIEDTILDVAEESGNIKAVAAAKILRVVLSVPE